MFKKLKRAVWLNTHLVFNYGVNDDLTKLVYKCIWLIENCPDLKISIDEYHIKINTSSSEIDLWNANKYFAWLHRGHVNGAYWDNCRPSKQAMYDFKECLKNHGLNIHFEPSKLKIPSDHIKC